MTLNDYKKGIEKLIKKGHGDKIVIFACDEEGNSYSDVDFMPTTVDTDGLMYDGEAKGQAVCIN